MDALLTIPPLIQVLVLVFLGGYVAVSVAARLSLVVGARVWDSERDPGSREHLIEYTIVPALVFIAAVAVVVTNWDSARPWLGDWSVNKTAGVISLATYAFAAVIVGTALGKRIDTSDARLFKSWIPLLAILSGLAALVAAIVIIT